MYFEESWYVVLCFRLNCFQNKLMTSDDLTKNAYDFEEGEIVDDDDVSDALPLVNNDSKQSNEHSANGRNPSSSAARRSDSLPQKRPFSADQTRPSYFRSRGRETPNSSFRNQAKKGSWKRRKSDNWKKVVTPRILRKQFAGGRRKLRNSRDRSRGDTPYEERLRDFQLRQQRVTSNTRSFEWKSGKSTVTGVKETQTTSTSLLKRLVGSGSVGIKLLDENALAEQSSSGNAQVYFHDAIKDSSEEGMKDAISLNSSECGAAVLPVNSVSAEKFETCIGSQDVDDELNLRMEALKTVVLRKHTERLKRGYVPKKTVRGLSGSVVDSFIEEVELLDSCTDMTPSEVSDRLSLSPGDRRRNDNINNNSSDMSMDSNYVSEDDEISNLRSFSPENNEEKGHNSGIKRSYPYEVEVAKKSKTSDISQDCDDINSESIISDSNEEHELRALALQSFFNRKALKDSDTDSDKASFKSEHVDTSYCEDIPVEVDLKTVCDEIQIETKVNDNENWEELDEDLLRAHLLKTLSANLPDHTVNKDEDEINTQNASKISISLPPKKELDAELEIQSKLWSEMMVPKLVISLVSDSESEPEQSQPLNFLSKLELLLQEAKERSEKFSPQSGSKTKIKKKVLSPKLVAKKPLLKKAPSSTPLAVKHLPLQQQEEYRRLKIKLAEKMKLNKLKSASEIPETAAGLTSQNRSPLTELSKKPILIESVKKSRTSSTQQSQIKATSKSNLTIGREHNQRLQIESREIAENSKTLSATTVNRPYVPSIPKVVIVDPNSVTIPLNKSKRPNVTFKANIKPNNTIESIKSFNVPSVTVETEMPVKKSNILSTTKPLIKNPSPPDPVKPAKAIFKKLGATSNATKQNLNISSNKSMKTPLVLIKNMSSNNILESDVKKDISDLDLIRNRSSDLGKSEASANSSRLNSLLISDGKNIFPIPGNESKAILKPNSSVATKAMPAKPCNKSVISPKQNKVVNSAKGINSIENNQKEDVNGSDTKKPILSQKLDEDSVANTMEIEKLLQSKDCGGNSDKENEVLKDSVVEKKEELAQRLLSPLTADKSQEPDPPNMLTLLKFAEKQYEESLADILRLEKQLEEAKKTKVCRERAVMELREKITSLKCPSSLCVKVGEDELTKTIKVNQDRDIAQVNENTLNTEACWDPDGVLCPFQLAGSCKDSSCSFHHIPTL